MTSSEAFHLYFSRPGSAPSTPPSRAASSTQTAACSPLGSLSAMAATAATMPPKKKMPSAARLNCLAANTTLMATAVKMRGTIAA